jgi:hypothetical protein
VGRTNLTYRDAVRRLEDRWQPYRRALRRRDRVHFDRLFDYGRAHADAAGQLNHGLAELPFLLSVLVEQERRLRELERTADAADAPGEDPDRSELDGS